MTPDRRVALALAAGLSSMALVFVSKTFSDTIFLATFSADRVPHFTVALAVLLVTSASAYGLLVRRTLTLAVDLALLAALAAVSAVAPWIARLGGAWVFGLAVVLQWLPTIANLALWNAATGSYSGRRARSFLPKLGAATTLGAVLGSFGASALVAVAGIDSLAWFAAALSAVAIATRIGLHRRAGTLLAPAPKKRRAAKDLGAARKLVALLATAAIIEALMSAVIDFGFKREADLAFDERGLGVFFSLFYGGTNVLILLMQLLATSRVLATKALRRTLSVQPVALIVAGLGWALLPNVIAAASGRATETILKFGVARPSQEIALAPLSIGSRQRWKVLLRGVFHQLGSIAGGLLLIIFAPALTSHASFVPLLIAGLAALWLIAQRAAAAAYLDNLGSALGLRRLSLDDQREGGGLDREGLDRVVELLDRPSPELRTFAEELLAHAEVQPLALARRLPQVGRAARLRLYEHLARTPDTASLPHLRAAVLAETDDDLDALCAGLRALAAHGDPSAADTARRLSEGSAPADAEGVAAEGWLYLARVGALDRRPDELSTVLDIALATDGARAAELYRAAIERGRLRDEDADAAIAAAIERETADRRTQALCAAAALGRFKPLSKLLAALDQDAAGIAEALSHLEPTGLYRLVGLVTARDAPEALRARLLRGLRGCDLPEMGEVATAFLSDPSPTVREVAVRHLVKHAREREAPLPRQAVEDAVGRELDLFELYARARPGYPDDARESMMMMDLRRTLASNASRETLFDDELERRTEHAIGRLCAVLALMGNPDVIYAAERALRSVEFKQRRQAIDVLQEVLRGTQRERLLELLEIYLLPPTERSDAARRAVCKADPWFARCDAGEFDAIAPRLAALRSTSLFADVDPEALVDLATTAEEHTAERGDTLVTEGDPGDSLFILVEGQLAVRTDGRVVQSLTPGDSFGELAVLDGRPRQATVVAMSRARLLAVPETAFSRAFAQHPTIGLGLVRGLARWLRGALDPRQSLVTSTGMYRRGTLEPKSERRAAKDG